MSSSLLSDPAWLRFKVSMSTMAGRVLAELAADVVDERLGILEEVERRGHQIGQFSASPCIFALRKAATRRLNPRAPSSAQ